MLRFLFAAVALIAGIAPVMAQQAPPSQDYGANRAAIIAALGQQLYQRDMQIQMLQARLAATEAKCGAACEGPKPAPFSPSPPPAPLPQPKPPSAPATPAGHK